ncbi:MAG: nuclear transport factor 2 family protein [Thermoleophilaceae bacterium]
MSAENVEVARRVLGAVAAMDLERLRELTAPDVEWRSFFAAMSGAGEYRGHEGLAAYVEDLGESWDLIRPEPDDMLAVGEVVLAVGRIHYRGKESGAEEEVPAGWLFNLREGKVTSFNAFKDPEKTLAGLGGE